MSNHEAFEPDIIAESENFGVWRTEEDEGIMYHIELGAITLHLSSEEWEEFLIMMKEAED